MENLKRRTKKIISIILAIIMVISVFPNFGLLKISNAADFKSGVILRLDTEKGIWTDEYGEYWAISLDIIVKDIDITSFVLPIEFDSNKLTPAYHYMGKRDEYIDYALDAEEFTASMSSELPTTFSANDQSAVTDWSNVENGKIVLEFLDSTGKTYNFEGENLICTINFIVSNSITDIGQINTNLINIDESNQLFQIFDFESDRYYEDVNTYFSIQGMEIVPSVSSLSIKTNPTAGVEYTHGEVINLLGGKLTATYTDGSIEEISMLDERVTVTTGEKEGAVADINNSKLTFEYEGKTVDLDVNVVDPVEKIQFSDKNEVLKNYYFVDGDSIPVEELFIKTITKSGEEKEISLSDSKISLDSETADVSKIENPQTDAGELVGIQKIQVTYTDEFVTKTTAFNILVNDMIGKIQISASNAPEVNFVANSEFTKTGAIEVIGEYSGLIFGEIEMSSDDVIVTELDGSKVDLSKAGESKELKVSYMGVSTTYGINVECTVIGIEVSDSVETKYGEALTADDFQGITITEKNADDTYGATKALDFSWIDTSTYNNKSLAKQKLKVKYPYDGKIVEGTVEVKVKNELLGIRIENLQSEYVYLDELNYEGSELYVEYVSGETGPYEIGEEDLSNNFDNTQIGEQTVTFTYSDEIDSVSTEVKLNVGRAVLEAPECGTLEILEDVAVYTLQLPTTTYGSVVWENPSQTLSFKNGETQKVNAVYKMNDTWKEFYQDVPMTVEVTVKTEEITNISLKTEPKLEYYEGQTIDTSALELDVEYKDGTTGVIAGGYTVEGIELNKPLTLEDNGKKITIKYKEFDPIELTITVKPDEVTGIVLNTENAKTEYKYNEELDLSNITVKKVMASGIEQQPVEVKDNAEVTVSNNYNKTNITAPQTISVTYAGFTENYVVEVKDYVAKIELTDETIEKIKTEYKYGDTIKVTGSANETLYINVYMASDMENPTTEEFVLDMITADMTKLDEQEVLVKYLDATTTFDITVTDYISAIEIVTEPSKRIYKVGESLDTTGLVVRDVMASEATMEAKDTTLTEEQYEISVLDSTVAGTKTLTITRKNVAVEPITFTVLVVEENADLEIQINKLPTATTYYGKEIDLTGGSIIVKPEGETEGTIIEMTDDSIEVEGYNPTQRGEQTVKLKYTYGEKTLEIDLTIVVVDYRAESIKITSTPTKLTYKYGESLSLEGGEVARLMASGIEFAQNPLTNDMVSGFNPNKVGTQTITVTYQDLTTTFEVTVVDNIYGISMNSNPDKVTYNYGEELNVAGATIKVIKDSGDKIISVTSDMVTGYDKNKSGEQLITVSYEGFTTQFTVTVNKKASDNTGSGTDGSGTTGSGNSGNTGSGNSGNAGSGNQGIVNKAEYIVVFKDYDGTILKREYVKQGETANPPQIGTREGYKFIGWDKEYSNIQSDVVLTAQYEEEKAEEPDDNKVEKTPKPTQTLGEKDEVEESDIKDTLIPATIGLGITGALLLLIAVLTKKNVEICVIAEGRKIIGKHRLTNKDKTIYMDEYKDEIENTDVEIVLNSKIAQKLNGEEINVVLKGVETSYTVKANGEEDVVIKLK